MFTNIINIDLVNLTNHLTCALAGIQICENYFNDNLLKLGHKNDA